MALDSDRPVAALFGQTGRVAVVTGAGSPTGIGFAAGVALGRLGARVVLAATTARVDERVRELHDLGVSATGFVGDLTDPDVAARLVSDCVREHGRLDIIVNNAGMVSATEPDTLGGGVDATDPDRWRRSIARNLDTSYFVTRAAMPHLRASGSGRVVFVSSVTGAAMGMRHEVGYAASKAALVGLARGLAVDEGARGVTANVVAPGWIATGSQTDDEAREGVSTPLGRSGTPGEVAAAIAFLASPEAAYVTGQLILVDGGNSVAEQRALDT
jgi:3-oxoacyl-[acyl-carrier protein] reductase